MLSQLVGNNSSSMVNHPCLGGVPSAWEKESWDPKPKCLEMVSWGLPALGPQKSKNSFRKRSDKKKDQNGFGRLFGNLSGLFGF